MSPMRRLIPWMLVLSLGSLPLATGKEKAYTTVKVVVWDAENGKPIPRAALTLSFVRGKKMHLKKDRAEWDLKTDSNGTAQVSNVPSGQVRILVYAKGYQTFGQDFGVSGREQTITVKLVRPGEQFSAHETPEERRQKEKAKEGESTKKPQ